MQLAARAVRVSSSVWTNADKTTLQGLDWTTRRERADAWHFAECGRIEVIGLQEYDAENVVAFSSWSHHPESVNAEERGHPTMLKLTKRELALGAMPDQADER